MNPTPTPKPARRRRRLVAVGALTAGLSVACAGGALAVAPGSAVSRTVSGALQSVGIEWEGMPEGYTPDQYAAFWDAGYTWGDAQHLSELWDLDMIETKARAGQLLVDGQALPITPGTYPEAGADATSVAFDALWSAGYTYEDVEKLSALWSTDDAETKARAGQALVDGQTLPVAPSGTATSGS